jgi:methionine--tRNA ligase beta chain
METITNISNGDLTDKGLVKMVDHPWNDKDGNPVDRIVNTTGGTFRETELTIIEKTPKTIKPVKESVDFNTVMSVDIRPGRVTVAQRVKKTDKLIHLTVKTSLGTKSVVTNLGGEFEPEVFIGKTFMFVVNMPAMKMKGILSEAMIMANEVSVFDPKENAWNTKTKLMEVNLPLDSTIL